MRKEVPPTGDYHEYLSAFAFTFIPRWDRYSIQLADGRYRAINQMLTLNLVDEHLQGKWTLGAYALDTHSRAHWLCFDADDEAGLVGIKTLAQKLTQWEQPSYLELSRRGGHLWLFLETAIAGSEARRFGKQLLAEERLSTIELYPKQDQLQTGPGSLVRLPLGVHRLTGKRYSFVSPTGEPLAPTIRAQLLLLATPQRVSDDYVASVLARTPPIKKLFATPRFTPLAKTAYGGRPSERIKHTISVVDFVSQYVELHPHTGRGLCPFHDDHVESFSVNVEGNYWHCFAGCGGGSIIDFSMKWRELQGQDGSFTTTLKALAQLLL